MDGRHQTQKTVACWKRYTCCYCGCQFRRRVHATMKGTGATLERAEANATDNVVRFLQQHIEQWPRPHCGQFQPEMIGSLRLTWHLLILLASGAWVGALLLDYYGLAPRWLAATLLLALAALLIVAHWWIGKRYPNNYAAANKRRTDFQIKTLELSVDRGPNRKDGDWQFPDSIRLGKWFWRLLIASVLSLLLIGACDAMRLTQDWPVNENWRPEVVGPGDSAWVFLPRTIQSLNGHWTGDANAVLEVVDAPGVFVPIRATTRNDQWGDRIQVSSGASNSTRHLWVRIHVPDDEKLAGKKVRVQMTANVVFPFLEWNQHHFGLRQDVAQHQEEIQLGPTRAGLWFSIAWHAGTVIPFVLLLALQLYFVGRAYRLKRSDGLATVVPCNQPDLDLDQDDELPPPPQKGTSFREERFPRRSSNGDANDNE